MTSPATSSPGSVRVRLVGWQHFTQGPEIIAPAFDRHGATAQLRLLSPGESTTIEA
jgi:hypothetical protein